MGSPTGFVDYSKLKGWYRSISRTTAEQIHRAKETFGRRTPPMENDPLGLDRVRIDAYGAVCEALRHDVEQLLKGIKALIAEEDTALKLVALVARDASLPSDLSTSVELYAAQCARAAEELRLLVTATEELNTVLQEKEAAIGIAKKLFEGRDRTFQKMQEEEKKWQMAVQTGDVRAGERKLKAQAVIQEMEHATLCIQDQVTHLLSDRDTFVRNGLARNKRLYQRIAQILHAEFHPDAAAAGAIPTESAEASAPPSRTRTDHDVPSVDDTSRNPFASLERAESAGKPQVTSPHPPDPARLDSYGLDPNLFEDLDAGPTPPHASSSSSSRPNPKEATSTSPFDPRSIDLI